MQDNENILVVVAARGGSKGVKNKNIRNLADKPLIAYTIEHAIKWGKARNIVCSTDSHEIAEIAKAYGAEVPFIRPKYLAWDEVGKIAVVRHALKEAERINNKIFDIVVDLDVTAPIRRISDLDNCLNKFRKVRPKTLFSVVNSRKNPYFNMVEEMDDGRVILCKRPTTSILTRQNAPRVYDANASIYFYSRSFLIDEKNNTVISDDSVVYVMDDISAFDIDTEFDFKFVEFLITEGVWEDD